MTGVRRLVESIARLFSWVSGVVTLLLMLLVVAEVVLRDLFGSSLGGSIELSEVALVFLVFLGVAYAQQADAHVSTNLLTARIPPRAASVLKSVAMLAMTVVLLWATYVTAIRGWDSMRAGEARFGLRSVPVWPARLMIPVGLLLLSLETLFTAVDAWNGRRVGATGGAQMETASGAPTAEAHVPAPPAGQ